MRDIHIIKVKYYSVENKNWISSGYLIPYNMDKKVEGERERRYSNLIVK